MADNISFDIIDGRKYKKCKDNQIRNLNTKRCNKIKETKAAKTAKKECPEGKVLNPLTNRCVKIKEAKAAKAAKKECPEGKVLNPLTNRCVKIKEAKIAKATKKKTSKKETLLFKINSNVGKDKNAKIIQRNLKKFLYPFINRVSANINDRKVYYKMVIKNLEIIPKKKDYCMRFYKMNKYNKPTFRLGSKIILKTQIGSESNNGIVYLSSFRDKNKKLFKYAAKIALYSFESYKESKTLKTLTDAVLNNTCPHFPILYGFVVCNSFKNFSTSSFIESDKSDNKTSYKNNVKDLKLYPKLVADNYKSQFCCFINELANGDLIKFIDLHYNNEKLLKNALAQIYLSLMFFYKEIKMFHNDAHWGNFLFHKIKAGGYFHYKIFGVDYYLENLGYLWVIWDVERMIKFDNTENKKIKVDFYRIIHGFITRSNNGWIEHDVNKDYEKLILQIKKDLFVTPVVDYLEFYDFKYTNNKLKAYIKYILSTFAKYKLIHTTLNKTDIIINKTPYIITEL